MQVLVLSHLTPKENSLCCNIYPLKEITTLYEALFPYNLLYIPPYNSHQSICIMFYHLAHTMGKKLITQVGNFSK